MRYLSYVIIGLIILISFFNFSELYYPWLNADAAVNILMSVSFRLPHDVYYWGQDRGGSLVPLIANILYEKLGIGLVLSVSLVHYLVLFSGFLAMCGMIKSNPARILLALFWFLPPWHMQFFLQYNFLALQFCLSVVVIYWMSRPGRISMARLSMAGIFLILATWVSDLAMLSYVILIGMMILSRKQYRKDINRYILVLALWGILAVILVSWARTYATAVPEYMHGVIGSMSQVKSNLLIFIGTIRDLLFFQSGNNMESIHLWIMITGLIVFIFLNKKLLYFATVDQETKWPFYFLLNAIGILTLLLISKWLFLNGVGRWYFVPVYYSLLLAFLLFIDHHASHIRKTSWVILFFITLSGSLSGLWPLYYPHKLPPKIETLSDFRSLGEAGIIGDYWNAYVIACVNPGHIVATPHDKTQLRNTDFPRQVFMKPNIYLVKDMWMEHFPDSIQQFGHMLYRAGDEFGMGDCIVCRYRLVHSLQ